MTKEFKRDDLLFSLCGLNCSLCPMFVHKSCTGCIKDSMCYNICDIVPCSIEHGLVDYCFECGEYPCNKYDGIDENDSLMTHINQLKDIQKAKTLGIERYNQIQSQKVQILHRLLEDYNYDNNELFFCTSVNLLPLDNLLSVVNNLDETTEKMTPEQRYTYLKDRLFECANNQNIRIELRKGKYNRERITFD